jgi:hypothetical protein
VLVSASASSPTSSLSIHDISRAAIKIASEDFARKEKELLDQVCVHNCFLRLTDVLSFCVLHFTDQ